MTSSRRLKADGIPTLTRMTKGLLQGHTRHLFEPGCPFGFFESRNGSRQVFGIQLDPMIEVGTLTPVQSPIVDEAAASERTSQIMGLFRRRIEPVTVGSLHLAHGLFAFLISFDVLFQSGQYFSRERAVVPFGNLFHLLQDVSWEADRERFDIFFFSTHASIVQQKWMHVKGLRSTLPPCLKPGV